MSAISSHITINDAQLRPTSAPVSAPAPFNLEILTFGKSKSVPLSSPCLVGREPRSRPLQSSTIHLPKDYDGVSRSHLSITRILKEHVKITLCPNAVNSCLIIKANNERVLIDNKTKVRTLQSSINPVFWQYH